MIDPATLQALAFIALAALVVALLIEGLHRLIAWCDDQPVVRTQEEFVARNIAYRAIERAREPRP